MYTNFGSSIGAVGGGSVAAGAMATADTASPLFLAHLLVALFALLALALALGKLVPRRRRVTAATARQGGFGVSGSGDHPFA